MSGGDHRSDAASGAGPTAGFARSADHSLHDQWEYVLGAWEDEHRHDAFLAACVAEGQLDFADGCYRKRLEGAPGDAVALRRRTEIEGARAAPSPVPPPSPGGLKGLLRKLGIG